MEKANLKSCELFKGLSEEEVEALSPHCCVRHLRRGELLFQMGEPARYVYVVLYGSVKLVRANADGKERIVHLLLKGDMFAAAVALLPGGVYPVNAVGLEHTGFVEIQSDVFKSIFMRHPKIGQLLVSQMSERVQQAHGDRIASFDTVDQRIAAFLLDLLQQVQEKFGKTTQIAVPLTRQDIADRVGTTVETVIRTLSQWGKEGLVITQGKHLQIPNEDALRKACRMD